MSDEHSTLHRHLAPGDTIDRKDQLNSTVLLGLAVAGAAVSLALTALL